MNKSQIPIPCGTIISEGKTNFKIQDVNFNKMKKYISCNLLRVKHTIVKLSFLVLLSSLVFTLQAQIQIGNDILNSGGKSGNSVDISQDGKRKAVSNSTKVTIFDEVGGTWIQVGGDLPSIGLTSLSDDGKRVAVGESSNSIKLYEENNGVWTPIGTIATSGHSCISLAGDGKRIVIGFPAYLSGPGGYQGKVEVYGENSGSWTQIGNTIVGGYTGNNLGDALGSSVSMSFDGKRIAIGAIQSGYPNDGFARVFEEVNGVWFQKGSDINGPSHGLFGWSIAISATGDRVIVGAYSGGGYVCVYEESFGNWNQVGNTIQGVAYGEHVGNDVSISNNGSLIVVGVPGGGIGGLARIYEEINGFWSQLGVDMDTNLPSGYIGNTVGIAGNGNRVIVDYPAKVYDLSAQPIADFGYQLTNGCGFNQVQFQDNSQYSQGLTWYFPGGSPSTSTLSNPSVVYNTTGSYTATLITSNSFGSDTLTKTIAINIGAVLSATISTSDASCFGEPGGSASVTATGSSPFQYQWSNGAIGQSINNLYAGTYYVTTTDVNNCVQIDTFQIQEPAQLMIQDVITSPNCNVADGAISLTGLGGTPPYSFDWSTGQTGSTINNLSAGNYAVTLTDGNSCTLVESFQLTPIQNVTASFSSSVSSLTVTFTNTSVNATSYLWNFGDGNTSTLANPTHTYANSGTYTVVLTATNACGSTNYSETLTIILSSLEKELSNQFDLQLYPNPTNSFVTLEFDNTQINENKESNVELISTNGKVLKRIDNPDFQSGRIEMNLTNFPDGMYWVKISIDGSVIIKRLVKTN